jgi:hypothetical protein
VVTILQLFINHQNLVPHPEPKPGYHNGSDTKMSHPKKIKDLLRACILDFGGSWEDHLPLVEFTYNKSYQTTVGMAPYEALYGRKCRTPLCWEEVGNQKIKNIIFR